MFIRSFNLNFLTLAVSIMRLDRILHATDDSLGIRYSLKYAMETAGWILWLIGLSVNCSLQNCMLECMTHLFFAVFFYCVDLINLQTTIWSALVNLTLNHSCRNPLGFILIMPPK